MGINITLYRILEVTKEEDYGNPYNYVKVEELKWFDFGRYSGDRDFAGAGLLIPIDEEQYYYRPKDFEETINWIKHHIPEGNQSRLLNAIEAMKNDENIVFHFSY